MKRNFPSFFPRRRPGESPGGARGPLRFILYLTLALWLLMTVPAGIGNRGEENRAGMPRLQTILADLEKSHRDRPDDAIKAAREALKLLEPYPEWDTRCLLNYYIISGMMVKGEYARAEQLAMETLALASKHKLRHRIAEASVVLGNVCFLMGRYDRALEQLLPARDILNGLKGNENLKGRCHNTLGAVYLRISNPSKALENMIRAEAYYRVSGNRIGLASVSNNIGILYIDLEDYAGAGNALRKSREAFSSLGNRTGVVSAEINIAWLHQKRGEWRLSLESYRRALAIAENSGNIDQLSRIYNNMAESCNRLTWYSRADRHFQEALRLRSGVGDQRGATESWAGMAKNYLDMGRLNDAESAVNASLRLANDLSSRNEKLYALQILADIRKARGDYRRALKTFKEYREVSDSILRDRVSQGAAGLKIAYEAEQKRQEIDFRNHIRQAQELRLERMGVMTAAAATAALLLAALTILLFTLFRFKHRVHRQLTREIRFHQTAQQKLRENEDLFRTLAERAPLGVFILQDGLVKYVNPQIAALSGYQEDEILERSPAPLIHPDDLRSVQVNLLRRMRGLSSFFIDFRGLRRDGEVIHLKTYGVEIPYMERPALLGTVVDVTQALRLQTELQLSREHESIARFSGGLAHDFNNLLAVTSGYLALARDSFDFPEKTLAKLGVAEQKANEAADIVRNLLQNTHSEFLNQTRLFSGEQTETFAPLP